MKNSWWKAWIFCMLISLCLFLSVAFTEAGRSPTKGWSRQVEIERMNGLSAYAEGGSRYFQAVASKTESGYYVLIANKGLSMRFISEDGKISDVQKIEGDFPDPDRYQVQLEKDILNVVALQKGQLVRYTLKVAGGKGVGSLQLKTTYPMTAVQDFVWAQNRLLYKDQHGFGLFKGAYRATEIENMCFLTTDGEQLGVIRQEGGKRILEAYSSSNLNQPLQQYDLNSGSRIVYQGLTAYTGSFGKGVFVEMKDSGSANSTLMHYGLNGSPVVAELAHGNYAMNPLAVSETNGKVLLLSTQMQKKGKEAILNVQAANFNGKGLENQRYLTRSDRGNLALGYGAGKSNDVLFSLERKEGHDVIKLSGSAPGLIQQAKALDREEIGTVLFNFMLILPMAIFAGMMPFLYVVFPTAVIMGVLSTFKMHVMEYHFKKVLLGGMALHLAVKTYYCYTTVLTNVNLPDVHKVMPYYLNTPLNAGLTLLLSTLAALGILKLRYPEWHQGDYYGMYLTFAVIDMSIFICLVMPYYASYMSLPIFY